MARSSKRWMAWWYAAISLGFALLTVDHVVMRDGAWQIGIRAIIACGFGLLAGMEFRTKRRTR